jgi:BTB/POZ domain
VERCPFFEKCLKNSYKEGQENQVYLAEESPAVFDRFVAFIYHNRVDKKMTSPDNSLLVRTFVLADKFCMPGFQNALVDAIACFYKTREVSAPDLAFVNDHVPSNSKIRAFLLDKMVFDIIKDDEDNTLVENVNEILRRGGDLATEIFWAVREADPKEHGPSSWRNRCDYHNHQTDDKQECYRKREIAEKDSEKGHKK